MYTLYAIAAVTAATAALAASLTWAYRSGPLAKTTELRTARRELQIATLRELREQARQGNIDPGLFDQAIVSELFLGRRARRVAHAKARIQGTQGNGWKLLNGLLEFPSGEATRDRVGYRIFKWLLTLVFVLFAILTVYGRWTYPSTEEVEGILLSTPGADKAAVASELRADWLQRVKDLGQLFVLTPIFPMIGAVIGYIFGVRKSETPESEGP